MLTYRTFRNFDPPILAAIWHSRAGQPGLAQPVSIDRLEQFVFGKVYFDYEGLILAFEGDRPLGFAHAAFGPNEERSQIVTDKGVTCIVVVRPDCPQAEVAAGLLRQCEAYLRRHGATVLYGGGVRPLNPFYLGLYGGSELPGVLDSDVVAQRLFRSHGYEEVDRTCLFRCRLADVRLLADRRQIRLRRQMSVDLEPDPPARTWWEACTKGDFDLTRFELRRRGDDSVLASATFREMEPGGSALRGRSAGLLDLCVAPSHRRQGLATLLLAESFRQLAREGIATVEAQAAETNPGSLALLQKLGMKQVEQGSIFRRVAGPG